MPPKARCTNAQKRKLIEYMASHSMFANGEFSGPLGAKRHDAEWQKLAIVLRECGPEKSVQAWKTTWRDLKRKSRSDNAAARRAEVATGNIRDVPAIGEEEQMVLSIIGKESSVGIGPPESGIGGDDVILPPLAFMRTPPTSHLRSAAPSPSPPSSPGGPVAASSFLRSLPPPSSPAAPSPATATPSLDSFVQPLPRPPSGSNVRRITRSARPRSRPARSEPATFAALQKENNNLLKNIHTELAKSNELRREQIEVLREQNRILAANRVMEDTHIIEDADIH